MNFNEFSDYYRQIYVKWFNRQTIKVAVRWLRINFYRIIPTNSTKEIELLHQQLIIDSSWSTDFIFCCVVSCLIASFGLLSNSTAVIIGAMLVAPLMLPLRGLAFSACEGDLELFRKAIFSICGATILSLCLSIFTATVISFSDLGSEIMARTQPNLIDLGIAVTAGAMSGFGKLRTGISDTLAGTAIAVALMPPLCVVGICTTMGEFPLAAGAFLLYVTNLLGITLSCMIVFVLAGYTKLSRAVGITTIITLVLVVPLGASFIRLLEQQKIEAEVRNQLINETYTIGQDVENVSIRVLWTSKIPEVYVTLQTDKTITPIQVDLTEKYINRRLRRTFKLTLFVSPLTVITGEEVQLPSPQMTSPEIRSIETTPTQEQNNQKPVNLLPQYSPRN